MEAVTTIKNNQKKPLATNWMHNFLFLCLFNIEAGKLEIAAPLPLECVLYYIGVFLTRGFPTLLSDNVLHKLPFTV